MSTNVLQKSITWTTVAATVLWTMSAALLGMAVQTANAAQAGDLIKMSGLSSVYYYASDGKRYVFPNEKTYKTWYPDFSGVVTVSQSELESIPIGGNVTYRPGTYMVKITTDPKVYAVTPGGVLHHVPDEATAQKLYGSNWNQRIHDVPDAFFTNYSVGDALTGDAHPEGTLLEIGGQKYYIDGDGNKRLFADDAAFSANGFQSIHVLTDFDSGLSYPDGSSITGEESDLKDTAQLSSGGGSQSGAAGTLTFSGGRGSLTDGAVVQNAARVKFIEFNVQASSDGSATVDSFTVKRTNLCTNSNFSELILLDENGNQVGNEKSLGSTDQATFNDDLDISAGTSKKYYVAGNMASSINNAENCTLEITQATAKGSTSVAGSFPIVGVTKTTNNTITIGTATIANGGSNPSAQTLEVGQQDYTASAVKLTAGSAEDIWVHSITFTQNGSAELSSDVSDIKLFIDGAEKATGVVNGKKVVFDFSSDPVKVSKGNNKEFTVRLDIIDGSGRTISLDIDKKVDVVVKGDKYGFFITPSYPNSSSPYYNANDTTIGDGSITFSKGTSSTTNVAEGGSQQVVGVLKTNVQGEPMVVSQSSFNFTVSGTGNAQDLTNVTLYDEDGTIVAGPVDPGSSNNSATSTDTFTIPVGIHEYSVKADLNSDFAANDTIQVDITPTTNWTTKGEITNNTITENPSGSLALETMTVKVGKISVSTLGTPAAQTVIVGASGFEFAQFNLDASDSGEDIRINALNIAHKTSANNIQTNIANLQLYDGSTPLQPSKSPSAVAATTATTTITFTSPITVAKGTSKTLSLKGDIVAGSANQTHKFGLNGPAAVTAVGADTGNSITATVSNSDGQLMTLATAATVTVADDASDPSNALVAAGTSGKIIGELRLTATNGDADLTELQVQLSALNTSGSDNEEVDFLYLYDGSTKVAQSAPTSTVVVFTIPSGDFRVPAGTTGKKLTLKADFAGIGTGFTGGSGEGISASVSEDDYTFRDVSSGSNIASGSTSGTFSGSQFTIYKSLPIVSQSSISTTLSNGSGILLYKFTVGADSKGDIGFYKATFDVTTDTATVTSFKLYEDPDGVRTDLTSNSARSVDETISASTLGSGRGGTHRLNMLFDYGQDGSSTNGVANGGEYVIISSGSTETYQLEGTVSGAVTGSSVQVKLIADNAFPSTYPNCAGTTTGGNACTGVDSDTNDSFIWSDLNVGNNSTTATNTNEWTNSYRVFSTTTGVTLSK